ncbi:MAG: hypothetical protein LQ339_002757 [Xanthoria mediterranea]|nr:MAG: hypothetical protein LQ339_002757 [Xanthoria mediterranea]
MSIDNIVIPGGILAAWDGPQIAKDTPPEEQREGFDVTKVARHRARTLSVSFLRPNHSRDSGSGRLENSDVSHESTQRPLPRHSNSAPEQDRRLQALRKANSVNLGALGQSRQAGLSNAPDLCLRLGKSSLTERPALRRESRAARPFDGLHELQNTYVFERLGNSANADNSTCGASQTTSIFFDRHTSFHKAAPHRDSSLNKIRRTSSNLSQSSTLGFVRRASVVFENVIEKAKETVSGPLRRGSLQDLYEKAKIRELQLRRSNAVQIGFEYTFYLLLLAIIYFVFIGVPLWSGLVLTIYYIFDMKLVVPAGTAIFLGIGFLYAYLPLLMPFEQEPPEHPPPDSLGQTEKGQANDCALLIPCYKSEKLIAATLEAALKIFPAQNIFVIANGNSATPLDNTAAVCERYGVSHTWSPIGSKIVAQYVGCFVAKRFPFVLLIDDDCLLPPNFPIVTQRFSSTVKCIGYTIKSVGPNSSKGTLCQQAQDVEYKISGIQRAFAGKIGSATFPHGAISIWQRELLIKTFEAHPGFSVSEDWFFGHVARQLGCRIQMCTAVFVETETPDAVFFSGGGDRGGFGEMTIWKQRFFRWNFFFVSGIYYDMAYILCNWKLGWWEIGAKIFVFQEVYETLLYLLAPFVLPISFYVRPAFSGYLYAATIMLYLVNVVIFNYVHLRSRHESVSVLCLLYYIPYKIVLTFVNTASCYYSIYKYAKYFAKRHPKVIEDEKAVAVVVRLEEEAYTVNEKAMILAGRPSGDGASQIGRRFTVTAIGTNLSSVNQQTHEQSTLRDVDVVDFADLGATILESVPEGELPGEPRPPTSRFDHIPFHPRFSWQRSKSNQSSNSRISPFDDRNSLQFPNPSPVTIMEEEKDPWSSEKAPRPAPANVPTPPTMPTLSQRRPFPARCFRRSSSGRRPRTRWPIGAPGTTVPPSRESTPPIIPRRIFPTTGGGSSLGRADSPTLPLPIYLAPSPSTPSPFQEGPEFTVVSSAQDVGGGWPLRHHPLLSDRARSILARADEYRPANRDLRQR